MRSLFAAATMRAESGWQLMLIEGYHEERDAENVPRRPFHGIAVSVNAYLMRR